MSLEEEIQQKEFRNIYHKTLLNLMYTHNHIISKMNERFKEHGITRQQYNLLRILKGKFPQCMSVTCIKDRMLDRMSDVSRIVERLRVKNLVTRGNADNDRREAAVGITPAGMSLLENLYDVTTAFDQHFKNLSEDECKTLNVLLDKLHS